MPNNYYGLDWMLRQDGTPVLLELNGVQSLFAGDCRKLHGDHRAAEELFRRMIEAANPGTILQESRLLCPRLFRQFAAREGVEYRQFRRHDLNTVRSTLDGPIGLVIGARYDSEDLADLDPRIVINPREIERVTDDKAWTEALLREAGLETWVPGSRVVTGTTELGEAVAELRSELPADALLIFKPVLEYGGRGIRFLRSGEKPVLDDEEAVYIVQELITGKPVRSRLTGRQHAASARVICFNGFLDGYWRLAPEPLGDLAEGNLDKRLIANIALGGHSQAFKSSERELLAAASEELVHCLETLIATKDLRTEEAIAQSASRAHQELAPGRRL